MAIIPSAEKQGAWDGKADNSDLTAHSSDGTVHVTAIDKQNWNAKAERDHTHTASEVGAIAASDKGVAGGVASLGDDGKIPSAQVPAVSVDAYTKEETLKDTTAALYGLTASAVPDEVLAAIKPLIDEANANANTKAKIQTGSYVGTGTYGKDNPCSLTFDFAPKLVFIASNKAFWGSSSMPPYSELTFIIDVGVTGYIAENYAVATEFNMSNGGKTMTWYNTNNVQGQMNFSEVQYHYVAIG